MPVPVPVPAPVPTPVPTHVQLQRHGIDIEERRQAKREQQRAAQSACQRDLAQIVDRRRANDERQLFLAVLDGYRSATVSRSLDLPQLRTLGIASFGVPVRTSTLQRFFSPSWFPSDLNRRSDY